MKIGVLDWGIGGVDFLLRLQKLHSVNVIYISDSGFTPYGKVSKDELTSRVNNIIQYLKKENCEMIIVACNAASTVIEESYALVGVIEPGIRAAIHSNIKNIGVVGGVRTIESNIYKDRLEKMSLNVVQKIAQPLSARVEVGDLNSKELLEDIERIFSPLKNCDGIVLACTHYIAIADKIANFIPHTLLIDPVDYLIADVSKRIKHESDQPNVSFYSTGNTSEMANTLKIVYSLENPNIKKLNL